MSQDTENEDGLGMVIKTVIVFAVFALVLLGIGVFGGAVQAEEPIYVALAGGGTPAERGTVKGLVVDSGGIPLPGVAVGWVSITGKTPPLPVGGRVMVGSQLETVSGSDGTFTLGPMESGKGIVNVLQEGAGVGPALLEGVSGSIDVRPGLAATDIRVVATPVPKDRILAGRVVDASGASVHDLEIKLSRSGPFGLGSQYMQITRTNSNGEFRFVAPRAGGPVTLEWPGKAASMGRWELKELGLENLHISLP